MDKLGKCYYCGAVEWKVDGLMSIVHCTRCGQSVTEWDLAMRDDGLRLLRAADDIEKAHQSALLKSSA